MKKNWLKLEREQTELEEKLNAGIHAIAVLFSIVALITLAMHSFHAHNLLNLFCGILYSLSLLVLYSCSLLYHSSRSLAHKRFFHICDHMSIYLLIAGTYTPFSLITLRAHHGLLLFAFIWLCAFLGILFKLRFTGKLERLSTLLYILMGWVAILMIKPIYYQLALPGFMWLVLGGVIYTLGVIFYLWKRLYFSHAIWHLCVMAGSFCHFMAIAFYVLNSP